MKKAFISLCAIFSITGSELNQRLLPASYPVGKIINHENIEDQESLVEQCRNTACSLGALGVATAVPLTVSRIAGYDIAVVPSLECCADQWCTQCKDSRYGSCCCKMLMAGACCSLFWGFGHLDTVCLFGGCDYRTNLGVASCFVATRILREVVRKNIHRVRSGNRAIGGCLTRLEEKLTPACCKPKLSALDAIFKKLGFTCQAEEEHATTHAQQTPVVGLQALALSLEPFTTQTDPLFVAFKPRALALLQQIESTDADAQDEIARVLQAHTAIQKDFQEAVLKQSTQSEAIALRISALEEQIRNLARLDSDSDSGAGTAPSTPEKAHVAGGGSTPESQRTQEA